MNKNKKIIILGGKGTAINFAELIYDASSRYAADCEFLGFAFDDESYGNSINGFPILCKTYEAYETYKKFDDVYFIFQMHRQDLMEERANLIESYNIPLEKWFTFIHPTSYVARSAKIGNGTCIAAHCAIHSNTVIGNHCTFSSNTTVGHDSLIENNVFTGTHACIGSSVKIRKFNFLGQNTGISTNVEIEKNNLIGLGASVVRNITESNQIYIGSPAKSLKPIK